jgi:hypothetical protein
MSDLRSVHEAIAAVMGEVQSVGKGDFNDQQRFRFRGIDAVMNAVGPALRTHGVIVAPTNVVTTYEPVVTSKGSAMTSVRVIVTYRWWGPGGDWLETSAPGEAFDAGDKGTAKAMSVAFRTMLLQTLCLPTDEPDPDSTVYERAAPTTDRKQVALSSPPPVPPVDEIVTKGLAHLRAIAETEDTAERIAKVASWKITAGDLGILNKTTTNDDGQQVTLERLADSIATGALTK